ncbi:MAG: hypothetical protein ACQESH_08905 [Campylobacterota bacterium]
MQSLEFTLNHEQLQKIELYAKLLHKDSNTLINEALELYFQAQDELLQQQQGLETNLDYDEFWEGVEL